MSDPVFDKMQNLMGKYQGTTAHAVNPSEPPILTDVVRLGNAIRADQIAQLPESPSSHDEPHQELVNRIMQDMELRLLREFDDLVTSQIIETVNTVLADTLPALHDRLRALVRQSIEDTLRNN